MKEPKDKRTKAYKEWKASQPSEEQLEDAADNITKGLGDMVASVTEALGIKQCEPCKKRQDKLNEIGNNIDYFFKKHQPNAFTAIDIIEWDYFRNNNSDDITSDEKKLIVRLVRDILNMSIKPCASCGSENWKKYIKWINTAYEQNNQ